MTLGNKVKSRREELGLRQVELAAVTKISQSGISQIENGGYMPSSPMVIVLAKALKISTDELLGMNERRVG